MYVIVQSDRPDIICNDEEEMSEELYKHNFAQAYEYLSIDGVWHVKDIYRIIDDFIVVQTAGTSKCPEEYKTYRFPNPCLECGNDQFMTGDWCLLCAGHYDDKCIDCGKTGACECIYYDY